MYTGPAPMNLTFLFHHMGDAIYQDFNTGRYYVQEEGGFRDKTGRLYRTFPEVAVNWKEEGF